MTKDYSLSDDYLIYLKKTLELKTDTAKLEALKYSKNIFPDCIYSFLAENTIPKLESDELKLNLLSTFPLLVGTIVASLKNDELKLKYLVNIDSLKDKATIISSLQNDELKLKYLDSFDNDYDKTTIISNFKSDELKLRYLDEIKEDIYKETIIKTFEHDQNKLVVLMNTPVISLKKKILSLIHDDFLRRKGEEAINEFYKNRLSLIKASSVYDERYFETLKNSVVLDNFSPDLPNNITIGIELEAYGGNSDIIKNFPHKILGRWEAKQDGSLPTNSVEITSPVLTYNPSAIKELYIICDFMKENGLTTDASCSSHIHIGRNILTKKEDWQNLYYLYSTMEKELYLMVNERGTLPRMGVQKYAKPISQNFISALEEGHLFINDDLDIVIKNLQYFIQNDDSENERRYYGINILNIFNEKRSLDTVEFRIPNGTLEKEALHQNIKLFVGLMSLSHKLSDKKHINILKALVDEAKVKYFLELIFTDINDINYFLDRYIENSKLLENTNDDIKVGKK